MSRKSRRLGRRPNFSIERLEDRQVMAGDVHAQVINGTLFFTEEGSHVGGAQNVLVGQLPGGKIRLTGLTSPVNTTGSLVIGRFVQEFSGVSSIQANLGGGQDVILFVSAERTVRILNLSVDTTSASSVNDDDFVVFSNFPVTHDVDVNIGAGRDTVRMDGCGPSTTCLSRRAPGDDEVTVKNSNFGTSLAGLL